MSYVRSKLAQAVDALATEPGGIDFRELRRANMEVIEPRLQTVFGRHIYGLDLFISGEDEEIREPLAEIVNRWMAVRQERSTHRSRDRASAIARELCNLSRRFPPR